MTRRTCGTGPRQAIRAGMKCIALLLLLTSCASTGGVKAADMSAKDSPRVATPSAAAVPAPPVARADRSRPTTPSHRHTIPPRTAPVAGHKHYSGGLDWAALGRCEASGNPRTNTGNGYYGLYQMNRDFWRTYGGLRYASRPDLASRDEQTAVALNGYRARGRSPWPSCGWRLHS